MLKFAIPALSALALTAFAAQTQATPEPARAPGLGWHVTHDGRVAKLSYGVANSDQLALMIECERGQSLATVYGDVLPQGAQIQRASLADQPIDPFTGDIATDAQMSVRDPALTRLAERGDISVSGEDGAYRLSATREERREIAGFLAYCGASAV